MEARTTKLATSTSRSSRRPVRSGGRPTIQIVRLWTNSQNGPTTLFDPYEDALALGVDISASPELLALHGPKFFLRFEILDLLTNQIVLNQSFLQDLNKGEFSFWVGNNWGPSYADYDTPHRWGLNWTGEPIFGVRALVRAHSQQQSGGLQDVDAFDVSDYTYFRVKQIFELKE